MPPTPPPTQRDSDLSAGHPELRLSPQTVAWLASHHHARRFVRSVWDTLTELERSGQHPGTIDALRHILTRHQPTSAGRCRTCPRTWATWRRRRFPCIEWHQIRLKLLSPSQPDKTVPETGSGNP